MYFFNASIACDLASGTLACNTESIAIELYTFPLRYHASEFDLFLSFDKKLSISVLASLYFCLLSRSFALSNFWANKPALAETSSSDKKKVFKLVVLSFI